MQDYWIWWGAAVLCVVFEIVTGTFYLLVLAIGLAAAGLLAYTGSGFATQLIAAAVFAVAGWGLIRKFSRSKRGLGQSKDPNLLLDIGSSVQVAHWSSERRTQVQYRGANWEAELANDEALPAQAGEYLITGIEGNRLILSRKP